MCGIVLREEHRRARKQHWCVACCIPIPKDFVYTITVDADGGKARTSKWHVECRNEFNSMLSENGDDCGHADWTWENGMPADVRRKYEPGYVEEDCA